MRWARTTVAATALGFFFGLSVGGQETRDGELVSDPPRLSALVVMRPASGGDIGGLERIASDNVGGYAPDPEGVRQAQAFFEAKGFEVFPPVALAFSIAASQPLFEETFGGKLRVEMSGGVALSATTDGGELEMSLDLLPDAISRVVQTVTFEPPPDFGPTSY